MIFIQKKNWRRAVKIKNLIKKVIKAFIPYGVLVLYRHNKEKQAVKRMYGNEPESYCPVCGKYSFFYPFGYPSRQKAKCGYCGSAERHRLLWLFFKKSTNIFERTEKKILHIAAEPCFESRFKNMFGGKYITADLYNPDAMVKMDITDIQ
jgi:hypothetical protein